jgi:hypothetical protein
VHSLGAPAAHRVGAVALALEAVEVVRLRRHIVQVYLVDAALAPLQRMGFGSAAALKA